MSSASPSTKTSSASEATPAPAPSAVAAVPANVVISDVFAARRAQAYAAALAAEEREPVPYASKPVLEAFTATLRSDAEAVAPLDQNRTAVRPTMRLRQGNAVDLAARERAYQSYQAFLATSEAAASTVAHQPSAKVSLDAFRAKLVSGAPRAQPVSQEHLNKKTKEGEQSTSSAATIRLQVHQSRSTTTRPMMRIVQVPEPTQAYKARREQARVMMERHLADNAPEPVWKPTPKPVLDAFRAQLVSGAPRVAPVPQKQQVKTTVRPTMRIVQAPEPTEAQKARREQARAMMERHLADNVPEPVWKPTPKPVLDAFRAQLVSGAPRVRPVMQKLLNQRVTCLPIRPVPAQLKEELSRRASRHAHPMVSDKKNTASTVHNARALLTTTTTTSNSNCIRNRPMMHIVQAPEPTEAQKARREQARAVTEGIMNNYDAPLHAQLSSSSSSKPVLDAFRAQLISGAPRVRPVPQKQQEKTSVRPTMHIVQAPEPTKAQKARREQARAVMERHLADNAPEPVWKPTPKPVLDAFRAQLVSGAPRVRPVSQANQTERQRATVPRMRIRPAPQQLKEELARREARRAVAQAGMEAFLAADDAEYAHLHAPTPKPVLDAFRAQLISGAPYVAPVAQSHVNKEKNSGSTPVRPAAHHLKAEVARRASRRAEAYAAMQAHYDTQAPAETANVSTPKTSLDAFRATLISGAPRVKPVPQTSHHERRYTGLTSEAQQQIELESHIRQLERLNCL